MAKIPTIDLPKLPKGRPENGGAAMRKVADTWCVVARRDVIAPMVKAGGAWVLTGKGPRVVLVDAERGVSKTTVKGQEMLAVAPVEPGPFEDAESVTTTVPDALAGLSEDQLAAVIAAVQGQDTSAAKTTAAKTTSRGKTTAAKTTSRGKTTRKADTSDQNDNGPDMSGDVDATVDDDDLMSLLAD